jgi:hypothetical protein
MATPSFESARTRKMLVDAAIAEMELAKARKEYVAAEDVEAVWSDVFANAKARLLSIPSTLAPMLRGQTDLGEIKDILEKAVHDCLEELASYDPKIDIAPRDDEGVEADGAELDFDTPPAAAAHRKRVGRPRKAAQL